MSDPGLRVLIGNICASRINWFGKSVWRKAPPRLKEFTYRGEYAYFVTCATHGRKRIFTVDHVVAAARGALEQACGGQDFRLWAWCFMPDHVHVLVQGTGTESDFRSWIKLFKQRSGYALRRADLKVGPYDGNVVRTFERQDPERHPGVRTEYGDKVGPHKVDHDKRQSVWQRGYHEHVLRKEEALHDVARYILENPVRAGFVKEYWEYPYSWAEGLKTAGRPEGRPLRTTRQTTQEAFL